MALSIGAPGRSPEAHGGEVRYRTPGRVPRHHRADRRAEAGGHHAHVGQHQRSADDPEAPLRQQPRHAGRPRQRHHRHPHHPRQQVPDRSRRCRSAPPRSTTSSAATSTASRRSAASAPTSACTASPSTTTPVLDRAGAGGVQGVPPRSRAQGLPPLPGSLRSESARGGRAEQGAGVHQRRHRAHARRRDGEGPAAVPQDGLPRPEGDGGAGPLRPAPRRRHPRRLGRHDLRRLQAAQPRRRSTAPASPCSAARSTTPRTSSRSSASCG